MKPKLLKLPELLDRKIYKTGQTRGADDDVIFQNRVGRNSTVLIPYQFSSSLVYPEGENSFENGFIVLLTPETYFSDPNFIGTLKKRNLVLGTNCLVFYETRQDWDTYNPDKLGWKPALSRKAPLGGNYVARVPATTAMEHGEKIIRGFNTTSIKGAGIRQYEYASSETIKKVRMQLEAIYWLTYDSVKVTAENIIMIERAKSKKVKGVQDNEQPSLLYVSQDAMDRNKATVAQVEYRKNEILSESEKLGLLDYSLLRTARIIDSENQTICPLCREKLSAGGFFNRLAQAEGRDVPDLTVTEINLFHIDELKYGVYNHKPYNLGWGHHHCNVVTKDSGISQTLEWMHKVLERNKGYS